MATPSQKRGKGRPKSVPSVDNRLMMRVSDEEKSLWEQAAEHEGLTLSAFARRAITLAAKATLKKI